jgi:hypothetical protein
MLSRAVSRTQLPSGPTPEADTDAYSTESEGRVTMQIVPFLEFGAVLRMVARQYGVPHERGSLCPASATLALRWT